MTGDDLEKMAVAAGFDVFPHAVVGTRRDLARFAELAIAGASKWLPASAPPAGQRPVLLMVEDSGRRTVVRACWVGRFAQESSGGDDFADEVYDPATDAFYWREGWYERMSFWDELTHVAIEGFAVAWTEMPEMPDVPGMPVDPAEAGGGADGD